MCIEFLKAGTGDCIWISHNHKNVVIDGGKSTSAIMARYAQMPQDENIDLLVVTHIDSDHIAGVIALVELMKKQGELDKLKQVWFNFPKKEETDEYSVSEGNTLSFCLSKIEELYWDNNTFELIGKTVAIGDLKIRLLAPDHNVTDEYKPQEPEELGVKNADWNVDMKTLLENVDDDDLDEGGANSQSIVILVECENKRILLPGDCTPKELYEALHAFNSTKGTPLKVDLMKLSHHGSLRNITKNICTEIDCTNFVISTKVNKKYCFPHKETIAKLICYRNNIDKTVNVYFNYQESLDVLGITEEELVKNNINLSVCREFYI